MDRRDALLGLGVWLAAPARAADADAHAALRRGGAAVLLRHAATDPGLGDPPGYRLDDCASQRNLSPAGREQAARIGAWFASRRLLPAAVRSSRWCRCLDTARLAFGAVQPWDPLDSFFDDRGREPAQTAALREALRRIGAGRFEVWVTHQVNVTALTAQAPAMGEGFVVLADASGVRVAGRVTAG